MARNKTTWKPGQGGKPKGAKDAIPRTFKASVKAVYEDILSEDPDILKNAIVRGLVTRKPKEAFPYVRLLAELHQELKQQVELSGGVEVSHGVIEDVARELERLAAGSAASDPEPPEVAQ